MTRSRSLLAVALAGLGFAACGDVDLGGVHKDAAPDVSAPDLEPDAHADLVATCPGSNPAARACRAANDECLPSHCSCGADGNWVCTADCRLDVPLCNPGDAAVPGPEAGPDVGPDTSTDGRPDAQADLGPDARPDVGPDAPVCSGTNPASRSCRTNANDCIPSACGCGADGFWMCTTDCRTSLPLCADGGAGDAALVSDGGTLDGGGRFDFCTGPSVKVIHKGKTSSPAVTSKASYPLRSCCWDSGVRLHTKDALGVDLEVAIEIMGGPTSAGTYPVDGNGPVGAELRTSWMPGDAGGPAVAKLVGTAVFTGEMTGKDEPWQIGLCVEVTDDASAYHGLQIYVPSVNVAPMLWRERFSLWLLQDPTLTGQDVNGSDVNSLVLAPQPILDLSNIDFVKQAIDCVIPGGASSPCMWIGVDTAVYRGSTLLDLLVDDARPDRTISLDGVPFVVMADGQRIYMGAFITGLSSFAISGPEVFGEEIVEDGFPIYPPNEHIMPGPVAPDLRSDPRILKVLTEAGRLVP